MSGGHTWAGEAQQRRLRSHSSLRFLNCWQGKPPYGLCWQIMQLHYACGCQFMSVDAPPVCCWCRYGITGRLQTCKIGMLSEGQKSRLIFAMMCMKVSPCVRGGWGGVFAAHGVSLYTRERAREQGRQRETRTSTQRVPFVCKGGAHKACVDRIGAGPAANLCAVPQPGAM